MGIFDYFIDKTINHLEKVTTTEQDFEKAKSLAEEKKYREAAQIVEAILSKWSKEPTWKESLARTFTVNGTLEAIKDSLASWKIKINDADRLLAKAKISEAADVNNPLYLENLLHAINLYQQAQNIVTDAQLLTHIQSLQDNLCQRQEFQKLYYEAKTQSHSHYYIEAYDKFKAAQKLFAIAELNPEIALCKSQIAAQQQYETSLKQTRILAKEGNFKSAIVIVEKALTSFKRADGFHLLEKIKKAEIGKQFYKAGLLAEINQDYKLAIVKYTQAIKNIPLLEDAKIRLALINLKFGQYPKVVELLEGVSHFDATYLRGLAYAKQKLYQQAVKEWQDLPSEQIGTQVQIIKQLIQRDRLTLIKTIETHVNNQDLISANAKSLEFISLYGHHPTVANNLTHHIIPTQETQLWESQNWLEIATKQQEKFFSSPDINSLHNWAIAQYYAASNNPQQLEQLITIGLSAIANLSIDRCFNNISWLNPNLIDHSHICNKLVLLLDKFLEQLKEQDLETYLSLRDRYRLDCAALRLISFASKEGVRLDNLLILPLFYEKYQEKLPAINFPAKLWGSLYTSWGKAIAAWNEGDIERAITLKPVTDANSPAEKFASQWVGYHEGCFYLTQENWRQAITPLKEAIPLIKNEQKWNLELSRLFQIKRQNLEKPSENLELAQFWYDLLQTSEAANYLAEYQAYEIEEKLIKKAISPQEALNQLKTIKDKHPNNPVVLSIFDNLELHHQSQEILKLIDNNQFEKAVATAKKSHHPKIRFTMAQMCLELLSNGIKKGELPPHLVKELATWAYELCPDDEDIREIYYKFGGAIY